MDGQLPPLKNFEAVSNPPEAPESWWKRCFSYVFGCVLAALIGSGYELLDAYGLVGSSSRIWRHHLSTAEFNQWVVRWMAIGAVGGFALALIACIAHEQWARQKFARQAAKGKAGVRSDYGRS